MSIDVENEIQSTGTPEATVPTTSGIQEKHKTNRASFLSASQRRAASGDLLKAHVALMEKEVILPRQLELFRLVNRHYRTLQTWHDQHTGWRIQRSSNAIRLVRYLNTITPGYLYERLREPADFACLTWILWYAENRQLTGRGNDQQFLLSQIAEQIQEQSSHSSNIEGAFDFRKQADRYSILRALLYLEDLGGIQLVDGQTREWVEQTPDADVLYEFTDVIRSLVVALNPDVMATVSARLHNSATTLQPTLLAGATETIPALNRAWRALLIGPALLRYDDYAAFDALVAQSDEVADELLETFGWLLDVRRDYACIVRASGTATGPVTSLSLVGASDQIAMLLCGTIRSRVASGTWPFPDQYGCLHVTTEDIAEEFYVIRERYGDKWGNEARGKSSKSLLNEVYKKMRQVGLLRGPDEAGNVLVLPTAARYAVSYDGAAQETAAAGRSRSGHTSKSALEPITINWPDASEA